MQPSKQSIYNLLAMPRRYVVPLFQRPYVWNQEKHWEPLWEDISAKAYEALLASREQREVEFTHFMGAIVLNSMPTYGSQLDARQVIDGQQRLITMQLLLVALRDIVEVRDENVFSPAVVGGGTRKQNFLQTILPATCNMGVIGSEQEQYKVWPTNADRPAFLSVVNAHTPDALEQYYPVQIIKGKAQPRPILVEGYLYFHDVLTKFLEGNDDLGDGVSADDSTSENDEAARNIEFETRLDALIKTLRQHLEVIMIDLESHDNPQIIFETLNARGEPLHPSDLVRNFVFYQADLREEDIEQLYNAYWWEYDKREEGDKEGFWKQEERQGRLLRPRLDLFMFHFLTLQTGDEIPITSLFQAFNDWWKDRERRKLIVSVDNELGLVRGYSDLYRRFYDEGESTRLGLFASRLRAMDTSTVYPLLLSVYSGYPDLSKTEREGILTDLESFIVRRMICGLPAKNYNRIFLRLLKDLSGKASWGRADVRQYLLSLEGSAGRWPTDTEFKNAWLNLPAYDRIRPAYRVEMILKALDLQMETAIQETMLVQSKLTVEHVWPRTPEPGTWLELSEEQADIIHTFGNLTLLTDRLNSKVSNGSFSAKRPEIARQSRLRLNTYFQEFRDTDQWTVDSITRRGMELYKVAKQVWPRP